MINRHLVLTLLALTSLNANADGWDLEIGLERQRFSSVSTTFSAAAVTAGYRWDFDDGLSGTAEASVAFGLGDDNFGLETIEAGTTVSAGYRLIKTLEGDWSIFARAAYTKAGGDTTIDQTDNDLRLDSSGLGLGVGVMYKGLVLGGMFYSGGLANYAVGHVGYRWQL